MKWTATFISPFSIQSLVIQAKTKGGEQQRFLLQSLLASFLATPTATAASSSTGTPPTRATSSNRSADGWTLPTEIRVPLPKGYEDKAIGYGKHSSCKPGNLPLHYLLWIFTHSSETSGVGVKRVATWASGIYTTDPTYKKLIDKTTSKVVYPPPGRGTVEDDEGDLDSIGSSNLLEALSTFLNADPEDFIQTAREIMSAEPSLVSMKQAALLQNILDLKSSGFPMIPR